MSTDYPAPVLPGYAPVAPYYDPDDAPDSGGDARALYHDQWDVDDETTAVTFVDGGYVLACERSGRVREWRGDAADGGFEGQPPPDTWVMKRLPGPRHWHEALDRAATVEQMLHALLAEHPVTLTNERVSEAFDAAAEAVHALYQTVGREYPEASPSDAN